MGLIPSAVPNHNQEARVLKFKAEDFEKNDPVFLYIEQLKSLNSRDTILRSLNRFAVWFGYERVQDVPWSKVKYATVSDYFQYLGKLPVYDESGKQVATRALSPSTKNLYLNALRGTLAKAAKIDGVSPDKTVSVRELEQIKEIKSDTGKRIKPIRRITPLQVRKILATSKAAPNTGFRDHALLGLLIYCGLRVSEVTTLRYPSDISVKQRLIKVKGKGDKERIVQLSPNIVAILKEYMRLRGRKHGSLFLPMNRHGNINYNGTMCTNAVRKLITRHAGKIVAGIRPHDFRHACATLLAQSGSSVFVIREILGHQSIETTKRYITSTEAETRSALNKMGKLIGR